MFLKKSFKSVKGKIYNHYAIVESYREEGKVKHRILFPVGPLSDESADRLRLVLNAHSDPDLVVAKADDIVVTKHGAYLDVSVLVHLWKDWLFDQFFKEERWITGMVINRCIDPVSNFNVQNWLSKTVLPAYLETEPLSMNNFDIYLELDRLCQREADLQSFIFRQLQLRRPGSLEAFFYDITSSYVTGKRCTLAMLGYSRDHRPDCEQVVIALMITPEGYPFYWCVMEGNTQDVTTICRLIRDIKARFPLESCTMVFDRGMVSADNLKALEGEGWDYVSAMDRDEIAVSPFFATALPEPPMPGDWEQILAMREFLPLEEDLLYYREFVLESRRYILFFDVARFLNEHQAQLKKIERALQWLANKNVGLAKAQKARNRESLEQDIRATMKRFRVKNYLSVQIEPCAHTVTTKKGKSRTVQSFHLSHIVDETALQEERRMHGITCFISNVPQSRTSVREMVGWYRRKNKVEEAFREIKSHLELRPIYLTRTKRVKAHVIVCVLAYFLYNDIEQRLKEHKISISTEKVLSLLAECRTNRWVFDKAETRSRLNITKVSPQQKEVLKALDCDSVVEEKHLKSILKKAESWL